MKDTISTPKSYTLQAEGDELGGADSSQDNEVGTRVCDEGTLVLFESLEQTTLTGKNTKVSRVY